MQNRAGMVATGWCIGLNGHRTLSGHALACTDSPRLRWSSASGTWSPSCSESQLNPVAHWSKVTRSSPLSLWIGKQCAPKPSETWLHTSSLYLQHGQHSIRIKNTHGCEEKRSLRGVVTRFKYETSVCNSSLVPPIPFTVVRAHARYEKVRYTKR